MIKCEINHPRPPDIKYPGKMAKKSSVSCLSVLKADPATRSGMIDVLQTLSQLCPVYHQGWHPPMAVPTSGRTQSTMVSGDYGYWEMGRTSLSAVC